MKQDSSWAGRPSPGKKPIVYSLIADGAILWMDEAVRTTKQGELSRWLRQTVFTPKLLPAVSIRQTTALLHCIFINFYAYAAGPVLHDAERPQHTHRRLKSTVLRSGRDCISCTRDRRRATYLGPGAQCFNLQSGGDRVFVRGLLQDE